MVDTETDLHLFGTAGSVFIGVLFASVFFSCTVAQTVYYFRQFPKDRLLLKLLVAFLGILDLATLVLDIEYLRLLVITNHGNPSGLLQIPTFWVAEYFLASVIFAVVQCYFIHKIWSLMSGRLWRVPLTVGATLLATAGLAGGIALALITATNHSFSVIYAHVQVPGSLQQVAGAITDIYITVSLCLVMQESRAGMKRTRLLLRRLKIYAINRGVLIVTLQLLRYATYAAVYQGSSFLWMIFHIPESKVYVNALLAVLNFRHSLREAAPFNGAMGESAQFVDIEELSSRILLPLPGPISSPGALPAHVCIEIAGNAAYATQHNEQS
ncbi:hypothetical protein CERSUDRAFT_118388 [Gelatoporia subvermispora B]|uniref:DUF6534 domain-containing protein n=1 Tax=Ceriporiopsis subvermispora (strain B) TaxID=914234 RepID=M2QLF9_CERS8|nr:hypothetical protein CERSUDRAFT_118388 [Gelatoporia subvermispora B]